jgi:hypothetical protein
MARGGRWALSTRSELKDGFELLVGIIPPGELLSSFQGYPGALIFAIATLDLLVDIFLNFAFEDTCAGRLVEASAFEDMSGIDPIVCSPAHYMFLELWAKLKFVYGNLDKLVSASCYREVG